MICKNWSPYLKQLYVYFSFFCIYKPYNPDPLSLLISKVIICTDGKANTELGNLEEEDMDARTLLSSTIFYQELGEYAANQGSVHISLKRLSALISTAVPVVKITTRLRPLCAALWWSSH